MSIGERLGSAQAELSKAFYEGQLQEAYGSFPQQQGLAGTEIVDAIHNPLVISTATMDHHGHFVEVPQLAPVDTYSWLNKERYERQFPGKKVRHFMELPDVSPGPEVKSAVIDLALEGGVLAIDFPESDTEYEARLTSLLDELGLEAAEVLELGTQAYYAGKVRLKDGFDPEKPVIEMHQAFQQMIAEGLITDERAFNGASYAQTLDPDQVRAELVDPYTRAFEVLNDHPCRQGLTPDELVEVASDPNSAKLMYRRLGHMATMVIFGNELSSYPWVNESAYAEMFPEEMERKQVLYFPAIATDPGYQGEAGAGEVIKLIAEMTKFANNEIVVAFDCCDLNQAFLADYIQQLINETPESKIQFEQIGRQIYKAIVLRPKTAA